MMHTKIERRNCRVNPVRGTAFLGIALLMLGSATVATASDVFTACFNNKTSRVRSSSVLANAAPVCNASSETPRSWNQPGLTGSGTVSIAFSPGVIYGGTCFTYFDGVGRPGIAAGDLLIPVPSDPDIRTYFVPIVASADGALIVQMCAVPNSNIFIPATNLTIRVINMH